MAMAPLQFSEPELPSSPPSARRPQYFRAMSRIDALGRSKKVEIQSAEIKALVQRISSETTVELAGVSCAVQVSVELGRPNDPENSTKPSSPRPQSLPLDRAPGIDPCSVGPADHYREWNRRSIGMEGVHPHKSLHSWGEDPALEEDAGAPADNLSATYAAMALIEACTVSKQRDRLEEAMARPIGVGRAGRNAAFSRQAARSELSMFTASEAKTREQEQMAHEDLCSAWYGEQCADQNLRLQEKHRKNLQSATDYATKLQAHFRGWCARCKCAIKRQEQKRLLLELRRKKWEEERQKLLEESFEARQAEASAERKAAEESRIRNLADICEEYAFKEDDEDFIEEEVDDDASTLLGLNATSSTTGPQSLLSSLLQQGSILRPEAPDAAEDLDNTADVGRSESRRPSAEGLEGSHRLSTDTASKPDVKHLELSLDGCGFAATTPHSNSVSHPDSPLLSPLSGIFEEESFNKDVGDGVPKEQALSPYLQKARQDAEDNRLRRLRDEARSEFQTRKSVKASERYSKSAQPKIKWTQSMKFSASDEASRALRRYFARQSNALHDGNPQSGLQETVRDKYLAYCTRWQAKPNSKVLANLEGAEQGVEMGSDGFLEVIYNFENAHLGDRGGVCLLHALAHDPRIVSLSLRGGCLRGGSASTIATFIELHPKLREIDLSNNNLSYEFGELLLEALDKRDDAMHLQQQRRSKSIPYVSPQSRTPSLSKRSRTCAGQTGTETKNIRLHEVSVNLEGTWFTWASSSGRTVGPPCGNLWAGLQDTRAKLAPSGYEDLRERLDQTNLIKYAQKVACISEEAEIASSRISGLLTEDQANTMRLGLARPGQNCLKAEPGWMATKQVKGEKRLLPVLARVL